MRGSEVPTSVVKVLGRGCLTLLEDICRSYEVCCLYGFLVNHILSCLFGSIFLSLYILLYVLYAVV